MGMVLCLRGATAVELDELRADDEAADDFLFDDDAFDANKIVDLDKAWNALQFMFTGTDAESEHPLSFFPPNAERIGTDNGYGRPWVFTPARVAAFNSALTELSDEKLAERYNPVEMVKHDVYLAEALVDDGPEGLEYVMQSIPELRTLISRCAATGSGMVGIIT